MLMLIKYADKRTMSWAVCSERKGSVQNLLSVWWCGKLSTVKPKDKSPWDDFFVGRYSTGWPSLTTCGRHCPGAQARSQARPPLSDGNRRSHTSLRYLRNVAGWSVGHHSTISLALRQSAVNRSIQGSTSPLVGWAIKFCGQKASMGRQRRQ